MGTDHSERAEREPKRVSGAEQGVFNSDLAVTKSKTITESNCSSFTQTITKTKSKNNTKTILKMTQDTENYINTVTKEMLKLKRFSMLFNVHCTVYTILM